jgi:hypothetical protein
MDLVARPRPGREDEPVTGREIELTKKNNTVTKMTRLRDRNFWRKKSLFSHAGEWMRQQKAGRVHALY